MHTPSLADPQTLINLPERTAPYWNILEYCRHIGIEKRTDRPMRWLARVRKTDGGYRQKRLSSSTGEDASVLSYDEALLLAREWFAAPEICAVSSVSYPVGVTQTLKYRTKIEGFTIGDAMRDYVAWKRISAARTHFEVNLTLINFHIIPRLGDVLVEEFTNRQLDTRNNLPVRGGL